MMIDCSIIIVNYNTLEITKECIASVLEHSKDFTFEIILVDNASTDGSKEYFQNFQKIKYIYSNTNLGFGRANNLGIENAKGKFLFLLNSDTLLIENSIKKLLDFFIENEEKLMMGSLGCVLVDRQMNYNGSGNEFTSCIKEIQNYKSIIPGIKYFSRNNTQKDYPLQQEFFEIGYVIGADLMMKRDIFNKLGRFDPAFFMYYEESDLQYRMKANGQKAYIYTGTKIIHLEDGSGKQIKKYNNKKRIITHSSKNIFLKKNDPQNFKKYKWWDSFFIFLSRFNIKYTFQERKEYAKAIKETYI
jgi:GT2 family glycosyltransferase